MRSLSIATRHFCLYLGPDHARRMPLHLIVGAIRRAKPLQGEFKFRVMLNIYFWHGLQLSAGFSPAWEEVPSVVAEYERTMR
ncbi:hypothetical protein [Rhizobium leguminosarum]|uniref:hypothetical protein n=1 Tax=Rhizobium leguminosarum TaxID=384 RepID=UPI00103C137C|nr:hypothetical protein [Rhizobium leguminosarum]TBZ94479.1 hypothetical protein E0H63_33605 [Rhizobium leguminosarum bv. viciae]